MTNSLKQIKSLGLVAIAAIFLFSATLTSCGDKKENADSTEESTEMMHTDTTASEHPADTEHHDEHPADSASHDEHPAGGEEHPAN